MFYFLTSLAKVIMINLTRATVPQCPLPAGLVMGLLKYTVMQGSLDTKRNLGLIRKMDKRWLSWQLTDSAATVLSFCLFFFFW